MNDSANGRETIGGYRVVRPLGKGGFGEVFLCQAPDGSPAAVKLLHATFSGDEETRRRFTAEVEQARRVSGFCIASILDADPEAARPWVATEFIDGPTLHAAVAKDGPRTGADLHRLAVSTATALAAIHAAGVVHRDLKPENIMLAPDGPRVIDFGIAKAVESSSVTASGLVGTIGYMAPEQLEGNRLTTAVDVFAWGAVMVYAASGSQAFPGPTQASRIMRILSAEPELGPLSGGLRDIVLSCLEKDPERRPDAAALLNLLVTMPADGSSAAVDTTRVQAAAPEPTATPAPEPVLTGVPYRFNGGVFTDPRVLAEAVQRDWTAAIRLFSDHGERAALGAWVAKALGGADPDLFGPEANDVNLAIASFVARLRPDLPPLFRGQEVTLAELGELFRSAHPLFTGAPRANEMALLARPTVLRVLDAHHSDGPGELLRLADDLDRAERAGVEFYGRVVQGSPGAGPTRAEVDPALILVFLLHPELMVLPDPGEDPELMRWVGGLWNQVEASPGPVGAGYAAAVYGALPAMRALLRQRRGWGGPPPPAYGPPAGHW
ncbi:serine/threonine protein kinase [Nocardiopsis sp. LOL_012]|uniref:serine/threonine protein kinase n=1 Tax=Nocardiopsis sp. LOL_012 TaxID=3345409 RepID=UPI003A86C645